MLRFVFIFAGFLCCLLAALLVAFVILLGAYRFLSGSMPDMRINGEAVYWPHFLLGLSITTGMLLLAGVASFIVSDRSRRKDSEPQST